MAENIVLRAGDKLVDLTDDIDLVEAIASFAAKYEELVAELGAILSPEAILERIEHPDSDPKWQAALAKLGLDDEANRIAELIASMRARLDGDLAPLRKLVTPVGSFDREVATQSGLPLADAGDGLLAWEVISKQAELAGGSAAAYALDLGAQAELAIEAGGAWPFGGDEMREPLVRIGVEGKVHAGANGTLPFSVGFARIAADCGAEFAVDYHFHVADPRQFLALALARRLGRLPDPFDFGSVWRAFADPELGFEGLRLAYQGDMAFDLEVGLGRKFTFARGIALDAGLSVKVGVKRPGAFEFTLRAGPPAAAGGRSVIATLSRSEAREWTAGGQIGLELDLAPVAPRIHALLKEALGKWEAGLEAIKPYLSPGTWIADQLGDAIEAHAAELVADPELGEALKSDLHLLIGRGSGDSAKVAEWLRGEISARLDRLGLSRFIGEQADTTIDAAAGEVAGRIAAALPQVAGTALARSLEAKLAGVIAAQARKLRDAAEGQAGKILAAGDPRVLGSEFDRLGAKARSKIDELDEMLAAVRDLVARYDTLFHKIVAATEDAARAKVAATIAVEEKRIAGASYQFSGSFLEDSAATQRIFEAMLRGRFQQAATILTEETPGFLLDRDKSNLARFASSASKLGYELVLFGFGIGASRLLSGEAEVIVGGDGHVEVEARAHAEVEKEGRGEFRSAAFTCANSLLVARALADQPPAATRLTDLGLQFAHRDRQLSREELQGIVESLVEAGFLTSGHLDRAVSVFNGWAGRGSNAAVRALVEIRLALGRSGVLALMDVGGPAEEPELGAAQRARIEGAYRLARERFGRFDGDADDRREAADYVRIISLMRAVYFSRPAGLAHAAPDGGWNERQYRDVEKNIAELAGGKIRHLKRDVFASGGFGKRLDNRFLTFLSVFKLLSAPGEALAETEPEWNVTLVLTHRPRNQPVNTVVLT